ncbi:protein mono-ADP-ribosyltransferase PARP14-like isoform X2 [Hyperolius riggenbachi]|uniref:protein mono-ADP-ribosyltransferase PARP14-like isoform X2 n=1 Tax=Hyperolius riggenbachi TaxID=752182 RepID=UPI0035A2C19A
MEDQTYKIPVALNWTLGPQQLKQLKKKILVYFQSRSKSGGGECEILEADCSKGYILIYFKEEAARDRVLQKKTHELKLPGRNTLQLTVRIPEEGETPSDSTSPPTQEGAADPEQKERLDVSVSPKEDEASSTHSTSKILIENIPESYTDDMLNMLLENISEKEQNDFYVETMRQIRSAVVTFTCVTDVEALIEKFSTNPRAKQMAVKHLDETRSIRAEGIPPNTPEDLVAFYFENERSGGGKVEEVVMLPDEEAALVKFLQASVVKMVMSKKHMILDKPVCVYPYYPSIGQCLIGKREPCTETPDSEQFPISPQILQFISENAEIKQNIEKHMAKHNCEITWPDPGNTSPVIRLSLPTNLSTHAQTVAKISPTWTTNVQREFSSLMSKYKVVQFDLKPPVWEAMKGKLPTCLDADVLVNTDFAVEKVFMVGSLEDVNKNQPTLIKLLEETRRQLNSVEEEVPLDLISYKLMDINGLGTNLLTQFKNVQIKYDQITDKVKLCGRKDEVSAAKAFILNSSKDLKSKLIHLDPHIIQFLKSVDNVEMSHNILLSNNITAIFEIEHNAVRLTGLSDIDLMNAEKAIKEELVCKQISAEKSFIQSSEWGRLLTSLMETFNANSKNIFIELFPVGCGYEVVITGRFSSAVGAYQKIQENMEGNMLTREEIKLHSVAVLEFINQEKKQDLDKILKNVTFSEKNNFIFLSGAKLAVDQAATYIKNMCSTLHCDTLYIDKPGAKKTCIENESMYVTMAKTIFNCVIHFQKEGGARNSHELDGKPLKQVMLQNGTTVAVYRGDLCHHSVDVIVFASEEDLKPIKEPALAIVKSAGLKLQTECQSIVQRKGTLRAGKCEMTGAGSLPSKKVIHAVSPGWDNEAKVKCERNLRKAITTSLEKAADDGHSSVAISVDTFRGSGIPVDICADNIIESIKSYIKNEAKATTIKHIHLVASDEDTLKEITRLLMEEFEEENVQVNPKHSMKGRQKKMTKREGATGKRDSSMVSTKEGLIVTIIQGNIEDATTDVVVNSVGPDFNLRSGGVSNALLRRAGPKLQDLVNVERRGKQMGEGSVLVTDGCSLSCNLVIHAVTPQWNEGPSKRILREIVETCLWETERRNKRSITFPAMGTRVLGFPPNVVASLMLKAVLDFSSKHKPQKLKEVNFMLLPEDKETIKAFSAELEKKIGNSNQKKVGKCSIRNPARGVYEMEIENITFQVKTGDDASTENADALVEVSGPTSSSDKHSLQAYRRRPSSIITVSKTPNLTEIQDDVVGVLQDCNYREAATVVFFIVESGWNVATSYVVADAILNGVVDFAKSPKSVEKVTVITSEQDVVRYFYASMKKREGSTGSKLFSWIPGFMSSLLGYEKQNPKELEEEEVFELRENIEPAIFHLCAENRQSVDNTLSWLRELILKDQHENIITDECIQDFDVQEQDLLPQLQKKYQVTLTIDMPNSRIKVSGLSKDVSNVSSKIHEIINRKMKEREAERYSDLVEWGYYSGSNLIPFDKITNMELEKAKSQERQSVTINIGGIQHNVIMELNKARNASGDTVNLQRTPKLELSLPTFWDDTIEEVKVVPLTPGCTEYRKVQEHFQQTCMMRILQISRVQNKHMWQNYEIKLKRFEEKNGVGNNERRLFHGTDITTTEQINCHGFNRSCAGRNDAKIGKGTYFATEAIYSSDDQYSKPDAHGHKHMYLARVLTGIFCKGDRDMAILPPKDPANPTDLYDSAADDIRNPTVFVIFNDIQAYPEYLITFTY